MKWRFHPDIVWADTNDEIRIYDARSNEFQTLNETGAAIWRLLATGEESEGIVASLGQSYQAQHAEDLELIRQDVLAFVQMLAAEGVLVQEETSDEHSRDVALDRALAESH